MADLIPFPSKKELEDIKKRLYEIEKGLINSVNSKSEIDDIKKRLYQIENSLLGLIPVIDIAYEYEARLKKLEEGNENMTAAHLEKDESLTKLEGEELQKTRIDLMRYAHTQYMELVDLYARIPNKSEIFKIALQYFDNGWLWMKEAILTAEIALVNQKEIDDGQGNESKDEESESENAKSQEA